MTTVYNTTDGQPVSVYDTAGNLIWGTTPGPVEPPVPVDPPTPPDGPVLNVATRLAAGNNGSTVAGGTSGTMTATRHMLTVDVTEAKLAWVTTNGYGYDSAATFRAAVSAGDGPIIPVTVGGSPTWRVEKSGPGQVIEVSSDPVTIHGHAGDAITVYVWAMPDGSGSITADLTRQTSVDSTATGPWDAALQGLASPALGGWSYRPARIIAPSDKTAWLVVGDSIMQQPWSYGEQALDRRGLAGVKSAQGGDSHVYYPQRWPERVGAHITHSPYLIDQFGVNGHGGMSTAGLAFWNHAKANGAQYVLKTTISPTTLQGAPLDRPGAQEDNAWLRDGAPIIGTTAAPTGTTDPAAVRCAVVRPDGTITPGNGEHPLDAVTDVAAAIESSPGYLSAEAAAVIGGDRLHPSSAVHAMLANRLARDLQLLGY